MVRPGVYSRSLVRRSGNRYVCIGAANVYGRSSSRESSVTGQHSSLGLARQPAIIFWIVSNSHHPLAFFRALLYLPAFVRFRRQRATRSASRCLGQQYAWSDLFRTSIRLHLGQSLPKLMDHGTSASLTAPRNRSGMLSGNPERPSLAVFVR